MSKKLNAVVAIEKEVKSRAYGEITKLHQQCQKTDLYNGLARSYRPLDETGEVLPPENKKVQLRADEVLGEMAKQLTDLFDITATKDYANRHAVADVKIGDTVLLAQAPVPYLLFLEKQITDIRTFIAKLPTLDEAETWMADANDGLFKTPVVSTHRTKKEQKPIVLYPATDRHPAQTNMITEDVMVGYWDTVKLSGAMPAQRKKQLLERVETLLQAVKVAREEANEAEAPNQQVGATLCAFLLATGV